MAGWTDVLLLDKGALTSGATSQAMGLVTAFNASATMAGYRRYSLELYRRLGVSSTRSAASASPRRRDSGSSSAER